jgi:hypothetical protein
MRGAGDMIARLSLCETHGVLVNDKKAGDTIARPTCLT